jgi:hypothetical protein
MRNRLILVWLISLFGVFVLSAEPRYYDYELPSLVASPAAFQTRDLFFLPEDGGFLSSTDFSFEMQNSSLSDPNKTTSKGQSVFLDETLRYALRDYLFLGIGFGFLSGRTEELNSPAKFSYTSSGARDPSFFVLCRFIDQKNAPYFLDLKINLSPSLGQGLYSNALRGGHKVEGVLSLGQAIWDFEYKFGFHGAYYALAKVQDGDEVVDQNPSYEWKISSLVQYDFNSETSLDLGIDLSLPRKLQNKNSSDYEKPLYSLSFELGPVHQFDDFLSASLKPYYSYELGDHFYSSKLYNQTIISYGLKLNLNYAF